jgi:lauroyl/myristoyl acyltransferase
MSRAQIAFKYDAPLMLIYVIRQASGLSFTIKVEPPVQQTVKQAQNDSLEAQV